MIAGMVAFIAKSHQWLFYAFVLIGVLNILCWWLRRKFLKSGLDAVRDPMEKVSNSLDEVGKNK